MTKCHNLVTYVMYYNNPLKVLNGSRRVTFPLLFLVFSIQDGGTLTSGTTFCHLLRYFSEHYISSNRFQ